MEQQGTLNILVIWRGKKLNMEVNPNLKIIEFGQKLQKLTNVKPDTLRLLVPHSTNKSSTLITPFSDRHSGLSLQETAILGGKPIRMMGVFNYEIEVSQTTMKSDLGILGFDEEEKRSRQGLSNTPLASLKLPQGAYIFCDFCTLHLPGIELNPPPSEALRRMHMLACDPGIIAIMNKHCWRVGIMTEMAPVGYVGISPKCLLGFNKNEGKEISLRPQTDDLKGFRKYESIKKTLLHELAHMVYSEHDANFFALNKQAASLDQKKSRSRTLSGCKISDHYEEELHLGVSSTNIGQKLGGASNPLATARASSVAAAYNRIPYTSNEKPHPSNYDHLSDAAMESDPDDRELKRYKEKVHAEPDPDITVMIENNVKCSSKSSIYDLDDERDPDDCLDNPRMFEPDPDDSYAGEAMVSVDEPDPDDSQIGEATESFVEPDPDDSMTNIVDLNRGKMFEPDPDDSVTVMPPGKNCEEPDPDDCAKVVSESGNSTEPDSNHSERTEIVKAEPDPDDHMDGLDTEVLQRIEEPVAAICDCTQRAIEMLRSEVTAPVEAISALQTLYKIIRNVIEHPEDVKFRRLRKTNPQFQRNVVNYNAAMEALTMVGFCEDIIADEVGRAETYLVLKRNDPGLLWLAKSSLEVSVA